MSDDFAISRRCLFVLGRAEKRLGIEPKLIPLSARFENALTAAMHAPLSVEAGEYRLLYQLFVAISRPDAEAQPPPAFVVGATTPVQERF